MKRRLFQLSVALVAVLFGAGDPAARVYAEQPPSQFKLHLVRTVFIEPIDNLSLDRRIDDAVRPFLVAEGFVVVPNRAGADVTLKITWAVDVVVDGGPRDYPKNRFLIALASPAGAPLWQTTVSVLESNAERATLAYQARMIARALSKAWVKSARRANYPIPPGRQPN